MNFERYLSSGDGDEGCSFSLNEREWHSYLQAVDGEAAKFFKLFIQMKHISNHLDLIFMVMKWRKIIFTNDDFDSDVEVETFHKNPIYIASKAIFFFIEKIWDVLIEKENGITASFIWEFAKLFNVMQREMLGGVANIDSCEFLLSICHFKNLMSAVDEAFVLLKRLPKLQGELQGFGSDFRTALFDIRELAWQSILFCNASEKRYGENSSF